LIDLIEEVRIMAIVTAHSSRGTGTPGFTILKIIFSLSLLLFVSSQGHAVELNGYYFGTDSARIWENQYFSQYDPEGDTPLTMYGSCLLEGYGGFAGMIVAQFFDEQATYTFTDDNGITRSIKCVVRREHGYWPEYVAPVIAGEYELQMDHTSDMDSVTLKTGVLPDAAANGFVSLNDIWYRYSSYDGNIFDIIGTLGQNFAAADTEVKHVVPAWFMGDEYTWYEYLAKDVNGNIHVLKSLRYEAGGDETDLDDKAIIIEGGTTLMYPQEPVDSMPVYNSGVILDSDCSVTEDGKTYDHCVAIWERIKPALDSDLESSIVVYLAPGQGIVVKEYDWGDPEANNSQVGLLPYDCMSGFTKTADFPHPGDDVDVELNGYVFSSDSSHIWENPYFDDYSAVTFLSYSKVLYGYGSYLDYDSREYYAGEGSYQNVRCAIICVMGFTGGGDTPAEVKRFEYWAKDEDDNIHLLQAIDAGDSESIMDDQAIIADGGTTLLFPAEPVAAQIVNGGYVTDVDTTVVYSSDTPSDTYTSCLSIKAGYGAGVHTIYCNEGSGVVADVYADGDNGFTVEEDVASASVNNDDDDGGDDDSGDDDVDNGDDDSKDGDSSTASSDDKDYKWYECFISSSKAGHIDAVLAFILFVAWGIASTRRYEKDGKD
jgi:hypothetical protein